MTYDELTTGYLWFIGVYSIGSVVLLAIRHRERINFKVVRAAMVEKKKPDISATAQARWNKQVTILQQIGIGLVVGWVLIMFFGESITSK